VRCLVVDDEPAICRALRRHLEGMRHSVHTTCSAMDAIGAFEREHFALAVIDYELNTSLTGLDVGRHAPDDTALIILTGYDPEPLKAYRRRPPRGYLAILHKPLDLSDFFQHVQKAERDQEPTQP
jgi:DNA-binding NtrC family response regulator